MNNRLLITYATRTGSTVGVTDAIALALRARAPIFVEEHVLESAPTIESTPERTSTQRLQKWLESLDADDLGKYKM